MRISTRTSTAVMTALALALALPLAACSDDATGPSGDSGSASAAMHDDPNSTSASMSPSFTRMSNQTSSSSYSGTMRADVKVQVSADGQVWTDVNNQATSNSQVALQSGSQTTVASNASVDAGTYSHVRVVMENSSATVESGSTFSGGGLTLNADVTLALGSNGRVVIEKQVANFQVSADSNTTIVIDLNSEAWIDQESVEAQAASSSEIESATSIAVN